MNSPLLSLPVLSCDGCGVCCTHVGTPPATFAAYCSPRWDGESLTAHEDYAIWQAMPEPLRQELDAFYREQEGLPFREQRCDSGLPCIWYDAATRRCRHHEHRPQACREFEVGGEDCLAHRALAAALP